MELVDIIDATRDQLVFVKKDVREHTDETTRTMLYQAHAAEHEYICLRAEKVVKVERGHDHSVSLPNADDLNTVAGFVYMQHSDIEGAVDALERIKASTITVFALCGGDPKLPDGKTKQLLENHRKAHQMAVEDLQNVDPRWDTREDIVTLNMAEEYAQHFPPRIEFADDI